MRSSPRVAALALLVLAAFHFLWAGRMLLASELLFGGSQLVTAAGLVFAAVAASARARGALAVGLGVVAVATGVRLLAGLAAPGPFLAATAVLAAGFAAAAWGAWRLGGREDAAGALALRGGAVLLAASYATFLALAIVHGAPVSDAVGHAARVVAALLFAAFADAPLAFERKAFAKPAASADG